MFHYIPEMFRAETADTEEEADRWYDDKTRPPHARPAAPRRGGPGDQRRDQGGPRAARTAASSSTSPPAATPTTSSGGCPAMYHQFKELADVDITKEPMEVGPTCHYMMGGVRVDAETQASTVPGLFAAGEVAAGLHGANRLGGNSLSDLLVFGRRAGLHAAEYAAGVGDAAGRRRRRARGAGARGAAPVRRGRQREPVHDPAGPAGRACRTSSASSAPTTSWPRRWRSWPCCASGPAGCASRATGSTTRAGTWRSTSTRCSPCPSASPRRPSSARRAGARHTREDYPGTDPELAHGQHRRPPARRRAVARPTSRCRRCPPSSTRC